MYLSSEKKSLFLRIQNKQDLLSAWSADSFEIRLAYLVDIFRQLNRVNLELQGKGSLIIDLVDKIKEIVEECDPATQNLITQHLEALEGEFKRYLTRFPKPIFSASKECMSLLQ